MFDKPGYGSRPGGSAREFGWAAPIASRVSAGAGAGVEVARAFVIGGNANTLAFICSLHESDRAVQATLVPIAHTPLGSVLGDTRQTVRIARDGLLDWIDQTFSPDDEHAFAVPARDVQLLARIGWQAKIPEQLDEQSVINADDLPEEIFGALIYPAEPLVQCALCRRLCIRDHFRWNDRQLCAWDYHRSLFGKRGPWRNGRYERRHFATLPEAQYIAPPLLEEAGAEIALAVSAIEEDVALEAVNLIAQSEPAPHVLVRTPDSFTLLRERIA